MNTAFPLSDVRARNIALTRPRWAAVAIATTMLTFCISGCSGEGDPEKFCEVGRGTDSRIKDSTNVDEVMAKTKEALSIKAPSEISADWKEMQTAYKALQEDQERLREYENTWEFGVELGFTVDSAKTPGYAAAEEKVDAWHSKNCKS